MTDFAGLSSVFRRDGVVCAEAVFDGETIAKLREISNRRINLIKQVVVSGEKNFFVRDDSCWATEKLFSQLVFNETFLGIARTLLQANNLRIYQTSSFFKEPNDKSTGWHQDGTVSPLGGQILAAWIPLVDIESESMGALKYAIHAEHYGELDLPPGGKVFTPESELHYEKVISEKGLEKKTFLPRAGDVLFHNAWVLHSAFPNTSNKTREVISIVLYPDGLVLKYLDNYLRVYESRFFFPGVLPGTPAKGPMNPIACPNIQLANSLSDD